MRDADDLSYYPADKRSPFRLHAQDNTSLKYRTDILLMVMFRIPQRPYPLMYSRMPMGFHYQHQPRFARITFPSRFSLGMTWRDAKPRSTAGV